MNSNKLDKPKQVIVMRKDLNMRKGKMIAQGAHASLSAVLLFKNSFVGSEFSEFPVYSERTCAAFDEWINGTYAKICVSVDSEAELLGVYESAVEADLLVSLITDLGATEFHGVPTRTCLAIGPARSSDIDKITGGLKLL